METNTKNNVFDFGRFGKYLTFDLRNAWSNFGLGILILAAMPLIIYIGNILFNNMWGGSWSSPALLTRVSFLSVTAGLTAIVFPSKLYGMLTSKKEGTDYLMVPASTLEKFCSMILVSVVIVPVVFLVAYYCLDGLLSLCDPTYGQALLNYKMKSLGDIMVSSSSAENDLNDVISFTGGGFLAILPKMAITIILFLLGALCFRKWKIFGTISAMIAVSIVLSLLFYALVEAGLLNFLESFVENMQDKDPDTLFGIAKTVSVVVNLLLGVGLMVAIFFRLKTLKH